MKIKLKVYGHLYWYTSKLKEIELETQPKDIESLLEDVNIPIGEVSMVAVNNKKAEMKDIPGDGDTVEVYPVIGGG
jgi:sulfur carrier protein ThiS